VFVFHIVVVVLMVTENYKASDLVRVSGLPAVESVKRHSNSSWTLYFRLDGEVELPDGRRVVVRRGVPVRATEQLGRKPKVTA
jgi:hypothetical protein